MPSDGDELCSLVAGLKIECVNNTADDIRRAFAFMASVRHIERNLAHGVPVSSASGLAVEEQRRCVCTRGMPWPGSTH
jgi:hypothetical protein